MYMPEHFKEVIPVFIEFVATIHSIEVKPRDENILWISHNHDGFRVTFSNLIM